MNKKWILVLCLLVAVAPAQGIIFTQGDWVNNILTEFYNFTASPISLEAKNITISDTGLFADGSATNPSISFTADTNTGFYRVSSDVIGVVTGGVRRFRFVGNTIRGVGAGSAAAPVFSQETWSNAGLWFPDANNTAIATKGVEVVRFNSDQQVLVQNGSATNPSIAFTSDTDTGFYSDTAGRIFFAANGNNIFRYQSTGLGLVIDGAANAPSLTFTGDPDTGMYRPTTDNLGFTTNGTDAIRINGSQFIGIGVTAPERHVHIEDNFNNNATEPRDDTTGLRISNIDSNPLSYATLGMEGVNGDFIYMLAEGVANNDVDFVWGDQNSGAATFTERMRLQINDGDLELQSDIETGTGSAANPAHTFRSDDDTGFWRAAANTMAFGGGGTEVFRIKNATPQILAQNGSVGSPMYSFIDDVDSGFYVGASNDVRVAIAGNLVARFRPHGLLLNDGTAASPSYTFTQDQDGGMYRAGGNIIGFSAGTTEIFRIKNNTAQILAQNGTQAKPMYAFVDDADTGMYYNPTTGGGTGSIYFSLDNVNSMNLQANAMGTPNIIRFIDDTDTLIRRAAANAFSFETGGTRVMTINGSTNYVCIGCDDPTQDLEIKTTQSIFNGGEKWPLVIDTDVTSGNSTNASLGIQIRHDKDGSVVGKRAGITAVAESGASNTVGMGFWTSPHTALFVEQMRLTAAGNLNVTGDLIAQEDVIVGDDLIMGDTILLQNGSSGTPGLAFNDDTNTGLFLATADTLGFAGGGSERLRITSTGKLAANVIGSAAAPVYSWLSDPDTGMWNPAADTIGISTGATDSIRITANSMSIGTGAAPTRNLDVSTSVRLSREGDTPFIESFRTDTHGDNGKIMTWDYYGDLDSGASALYVGLDVFAAQDAAASRTGEIQWSVYNTGVETKPLVLQGNHIGLAGITNPQATVDISHGSQTSGDVVAVDGTTITSGDALEITVNSSVVTTGKAINVLSGDDEATAVFIVDEDGDYFSHGDLTLSNEAHSTTILGNSGTLKMFSGADTAAPGFFMRQPGGGANLGNLDIYYGSGSQNETSADMALNFNYINNSGISEKMRLTELGYLGIGTTSPQLPFHVDGGGTANIMRIQRDGGTPDDNNYTFRISSDAGVAGSLGIFAETQNGVAGEPDINLRAKSSGPPQLVLKGATGRVGIGTSSPGRELVVNGSISALGPSGFDRITLIPSTGAGSVNVINNQGKGEGSLSATLNAGATLSLDNNSEVTRIYLSADSASYFNSGNVGIGTTAPTHELNVNGSANITGTVYAHNYSGNSDIVFINASGTEIVRFADDGDVGIGDATPDEALDVVGNIVASGTFLAANGAEGTPPYTFTGDTDSGFYWWATDRYSAVASGKTVLIFSGSGGASAVNYLRINNAATGVDPEIEAAGSDTNIDLRLESRGTGGVVVNSGTQTDPGYSFIGDDDTGFYSITGNTIGVALGGSPVGGFVAQQLLFSDGAVGAPTFSWLSDDDTGMYRVGTNTLGLVAGGTKMIDINATSGIVQIDSFALGQMYFHNDTNGNITALTEDVWTEMKPFDQEENGQKLNGFTYSASNLTPDLSGLYTTEYHVTFTGTANNKYHTAVGLNGAEQFYSEAHAKTSTATDVLSTSGGGFLNITAGDNVNLMMMNEDSGGDATVLSANLHLYRIGALQ